MCCGYMTCPSNYKHLKRSNVVCGMLDIFETNALTCISLTGVYACLPEAALGATGSQIVKCHVNVIIV